ncbi:hypothetical protein LXH09_27870 [Streptomyces sp. CS7]|uniref:hypothetical protein n=1 Tax=Streptomyces sp. CS-7 TaxID=2906769 RepID=UPI0021B17A8F|nr:hypothetical protein [Streptomyces sp. CS-7]MCT6780464.1 hypothetical protein [Streptomyces sp. CS-7]
MSHPAPHPIGLADEITRQLQLLAEHVAVLPPDQATQVIAHILNPDAGLFDRVIGLVSVSSTFAKVQAERGVLPAEVWLALGRAANDLDAVGGDLDEHRDTLRRFGTQPATGAAKPPAPAPLVVRRSR